jgi:hypothetical protein
MRVFIIVFQVQQEKVYGNPREVVQVSGQIQACQEVEE